MAKVALDPTLTDPNAPVEPNGAKPPAPSAIAPPTTVTGDPSIAGQPQIPPAPSTTAATTPGQPPSPATGITQLPDGAGGAINVPPPGVTPVPYNPIPMTAAGAPPAGPAPVVAPDTGGTVSTSQFGPGGNLINTQINPTADPRTLSLQGLQDATLQKILNGPDRNKMAMDQYNTWDAATAPQLAHSISDATDAAAAHGQIKSGQLTNRYGDLAQQRVLDQTTARNKYMQNALDASIADTQTGFQDVSGAAGTAANQGLTGREELRGERGYQTSQAQQALLNRIRQQQAEAAARAQSLGEGTTTYGMGNEGDPTGALQGASAQSADEAAAAAGDTGALLRILAQRRGTGSGSSAVAA